MHPAGLYAPDAYWKLPPKTKEALCNGCGTKGIVGFVVPDTVWFLCITEACDIHDFMYAVGQTIEDKAQADQTFLTNMLRLIEYNTRFFVLKALRARRALKYYEAVRDFGGPAFWRSKG